MKNKPAKAPAEYAVGYCKPPVAHRFQPGNQEHLKRSNGSVSEAKLYRQLAAASVRATRKGSVVYVSRLQMLVDTYVAGAVRGDTASAAALLTLHSRSKVIGDLMPLILVIDGLDAKC